MCGIGGIVYRDDAPRGSHPVGDGLIKMLQSLAHRGMDSTGVTVSGGVFEASLMVRLWVEDGYILESVFSDVGNAVKEVGGVIGFKETKGRFLRLGVTSECDVRALADVLFMLEGVVVHSIGENSEVIKDIGTAMDIDGRHNVSGLYGTHGIGHVRMATESIVDITHSHPFWAYPFPDISVVHNGQLTNYHKLKRHYEGEGYQFQTQNDSELIAVYLADKLFQDNSLEDALISSLDDLDGTFTFLVSTKDAIGYAKDRWAAKPLVTMETDSVVAVASEEVALRSVFSDEIRRIEPQQSEVMTWQV